ncbi:hypothetical protein MMC22_002212 [Lobaria immixta]|nr:hypothetical protein [Lobaria immixta]
MSHQDDATSAPQSRGDAHNAQSRQAIVDRTHGSNTGGLAYTESNNHGNNGQAHLSNGNNHQAHSSASTEAGGAPPPSASVRTSSRVQYPPCPFHGPILHTPSAHRSQGQGLDPLSRFLAEGPSEQHALFIRADTGALSTSRGCTCRVALEGWSR